MKYNLCYDIASLTLLGILLFYYIYTPKYKSFQNRLFGVILSLSFISCLIDLLSAGYFLLYMADNIPVNRISLVLYQMCQHALPALYFLYILVVIFDDIKAIRSTIRLLFIPVAAVELINFLTFFFPLAFAYDSTGYHRTWFYFGSFGTMAFYIILSLGAIFKYKSKTVFLSRFAVFCYTVLTILCIILQFFYPDQLLICSGVTIAVFTMYMSLQSPSLLKEALEDAERSKKIAEEANEARANFIANLNHEIRTPIDAICGMTYLLEKSDLSQTAEEYAATIRSASNNLLSLINDVLDFSKVDAGKMNLSETEYNIFALAKDITDLFYSTIRHDKVVGSLYIDPSVPLVIRGDVHKTKQILMNLLNNAVKYTEEGQILLHISAKVKENNMVTMTFKVKDTGIGIKSEDQATLFDQFKTIGLSKANSGEGTGLGLTLVKSLCELMNGHVEVESTWGKGSTFTAVIDQECIEPMPESFLSECGLYTYLLIAANPFERRCVEKTLKSVNADYRVIDVDKPIPELKIDGKYCVVYNYDDSNEAVSQLWGNNNDIVKIAAVDGDFAIDTDSPNTIFVRKPFSLGSLFGAFGSEKGIGSVSDEVQEDIYFLPETRVAVVDDNKVSLKVIGAVMQKFGINPRLFKGGEEIMESLKAGEEFDMIFMDHLMPNMDGADTTKIIRGLKIGNCARVPIVAITANAVNGVKDELMQAGMNDVLFKPLNVDLLREDLAKWLPRNLRCEELKNEEDQGAV